VGCARKSAFATVAQAGDSGLQASLELSSSTLDAPALVLKMAPAITASLVNFSELSKRLHT